MPDKMPTTDYGPRCAELLSRRETCELGPGSPDQSRRATLQALTDAALFAGRQVVDENMAACCRAALWLRHDFLDESHRISQDIETTTGSYWHGIMHRREPDYPNAKYWFRRVGQHAVFPELCVVARDVAAELQAAGSAAYLLQQSAWDAFRFVDLCEAASRQRTDEQLCRHVADAEWRWLFDYSYRMAVGIAR